KDAAQPGLKRASDLYGPTPESFRHDVATWLRDIGEMPLARLGQQSDVVRCSYDHSIVGELSTARLTREPEGVVLSRRDIQLCNSGPSVGRVYATQVSESDWLAVRKCLDRTGFQSGSEYEGGFSTDLPVYLLEEIWEGRYHAVIAPGDAGPGATPIECCKIVFGLAPLKQRDVGPPLAKEDRL